MADKDRTDHPAATSGYYRPDGADRWDEIELIGKKDPHETGVRDHTDPQHREYMKEIVFADVKELHRGPEQRRADAPPANEIRSILSENRKRPEPKI